MLRLEEALYAWTERRLTQEEAAQLLGVSPRTFRRYVDRHEEAGLDGLVDKRLTQVSAHTAPVDEVLRLQALYRERYRGWSVAHFHDRYRERHAGERSYTWVKNRLRESDLVSKGKARGHAAAAGAGADPGAAGAPGRLDARVGGRNALGSDRDDGRRDVGSVLGVLCRRGRDLVEPSRRGVGQRVRATARRRTRRYPVPERGAHGGAGQLREPPGPAAATAGGSRTALREASGSGARARGRHCRCPTARGGSPGTTPAARRWNRSHWRRDSGSPPGTPRCSPRRRRG